MKAQSTATNREGALCIRLGPRWHGQHPRHLPEEGFGFRVLGLRFRVWLGVAVWGLCFWWTEVLRSFL